MITKTILATLIFYSSMGSAQYQPLKIGEQVPDFLINNVTNYHKNSLRLSEFRGKYVILDFWDHTCASCLEAFPKMDSLQQQFSKDIQMVTVNPRSAAATTALFKRLKNLHLPKMPFVNADTSLKQLFPYVGAPHHIWIDRDGKFLFPADNFNLNRDSLTQLIARGTIDVLPKVKTTILKTFMDARFESNVVFASYIVRESENKFRVLPSGVNGIVHTGFISHLYIEAYSSLTKNKYELRSPGRLVLELDSPQNYKNMNLKGRALKEWKYRNNYIYQSILPKNSKLDPNKVMVEDLERFFNVRGTIEKRPLKTLVLVRTSTIDKLSTHGGEKKHTLAASIGARSPIGKSDVRELINADYSILINRVKSILKKLTPSMPFKDGTGYTGKIDLTFDADLLDHPTFEKLKNALQKYDLDLVEQDVSTDVLVLRDIK